MVVALSCAGNNDPIRLRSLRSGSAEGWVPIPDPPIGVLSERLFPPSLCCVEEVIYVIGGRDVSGATSNALQAYELSTRAWAVLAPLPVPRCRSKCVLLAWRLYVVGGNGDRGDQLASVFSYDPRTDQWRSESQLPFEDSRVRSRLPMIYMISAAAHERSVVVVGGTPAPHLAIADSVWTELPPFPSRPGYSRSAALSGRLACVASLCLGY